MNVAKKVEVDNVECGQYAVVVHLRSNEKRRNYLILMRPFNLN